MELAESVAITFEMQMQKHEWKDDIVIHVQKTDDQVICPVLQWTRLINQVWSYEGTRSNTPVCTFKRSGGWLDKIASSQVLTRLQVTAEAVGSARLGFEPHEIGTHSLCSGAGVPVYTIMLIGRWSSNAFLHYI